MVSIEKQIEVAKQKPLTAENLNYIGDLYLKLGDRKRATAYFFEAVDKLHFAQKEKKIAIYKKIINTDPYSERAYLAIVEIMAKMGLVMEEKKYLHTLARIYEDRGDTIRSEELFERIRELDPHVSIPGTFVHHRESYRDGSSDAETEETARSLTGDEASEEQINEAKPKLIEASLEPEHYDEKRPEKSSVAVRVSSSRRKLLVPLSIAALLILALLVLIWPVRRTTKPGMTPLYVSVVKSGYEIKISKVEDNSSLKGVIEDDILAGHDIYIFSIKSMNGCLPELFASSPHNMIMLLDDKGEAVKTAMSAGLERSIKRIYRTNICGRDEAAVFEKLHIAAVRDRSCQSLSISGLESQGPLIVGKK